MYPLPCLSLEQAIKMQFRLVDIIHRHFTGDEILTAGDYGLRRGYGRPRATAQVEEVLAEWFAAEDAVLVRGAGTGALRAVFNTLLKPGEGLLVHDAPMYPTTRVTVAAMGLKLVTADFHNRAELAKAAREAVRAVLIQHTRQRMADRYDLGEVIAAIRAVTPEVLIITDDNYAVCKSPDIGCQLGADASTFSLFKLLGPEGVGCVVGRAEVVKAVRDSQYSGGSQVQGPEAMEALRGLVYAPVTLALQARVCDEVAQRLREGAVPGVKNAWVANAQSRVVLVEFAAPIAAAVLEESRRRGAAPHPVGAESRYEIAALFYRVSGTFLADNPGLATRMIRINPMRAGAETVIRILREAVAAAGGEQACL